MEYLTNRFEEERLPEDEDVHDVISRLLSEENPKALLFTDLHHALIGIARQQYKSLPVYDYDKCIEIFMERDGMTYEDAAEHMSFNTEGSWVGENTPLLVHREELLVPVEPVPPEALSQYFVPVNLAETARKFMPEPAGKPLPFLQCPLGAEDLVSPDELELG